VFGANSKNVKNAWHSLFFSLFSDGKEEST
jgi:hypothetical protein